MTDLNRLRDRLRVLRHDALALLAVGIRRLSRAGAGGH